MNADRENDSQVQFLPSLQIDQENFLPFDDRKGLELLMKPAGPVSPSVLEKQIYLLKGMQPHLLFAFLDNVSQLTKLPAAPSLEADATTPATVPLQETGCHRFLSSFLPFLPYPLWARPQQPAEGACGELAEDPAAVSQHIPTLEELSETISDRIRQGAPQLSESRPSPNKFIETKIRAGSMPCRKFERIFICNIKKELPLSVLQWLLDAFTLPASVGVEGQATTEDEAGQRPKPLVDFTLSTGLIYPTSNYIYDAVIHRSSKTSAFKGCVHVTLATDDDPDRILQLFHKRFLFDHSGVWVATTPHEAALLQAYCTALTQAWEAGDPLIRGHLGTLPRSPVTWELVDTERRNRQMDPHAMFLQSVLDSRTRGLQRVTRQ